MRNSAWISCSVLAFALAPLGAKAADPATSSSVAATAAWAQGVTEWANTVAAAGPVSELMGELAFGNGFVHDSATAAAERISTLAHHRLQAQVAVANEEHKLFETIGILNTVANTGQTVQNTIDQIKLADDTAALLVSHGADILEFINSLSGPRSGRFFYDSATIRQINRTINEYEKLKDWNISFKFDFEFPTDRIAQPSGVQWDTINRRLGAAVDYMDMAIAETQTETEGTRKSVGLINNRAVLEWGTSNILQANKFIARELAQMTKIQAMELQVMKATATLDGRDKDAEILRKAQNEMGSNASAVSAFTELQDAQARRLAQGIARVRAVRGGTNDNDARRQLNNLMGAEFLMMEDDESALTAPRTNSYSSTRTVKGR